MEHHEMFDELARQQHGSLSRAQAYEIGITRSALRAGVQSGRLLAVTRDVFRVPAAPRTQRQKLMEGVLDAGRGAATSHEAATWLWGVPGFFEGPVETTRARGPRRGAARLSELHETRVWPPHHRTVVDGIPVTTPCRTLFDLAGAPDLSGDRVERALEHVLKTTPSALRTLRRMLVELSVQGRPGLELMRELLAARPPGYVPAESGFELLVKRLLDEEGIPTRRQVNVYDWDEEAWLGRVDLDVIGEPVLVEVDSAAHHSSLLDRRRDAHRDQAMARAGLLVVRINEEDAFHRPWTVGSKVRQGIRTARSAFLGAPRSTPVPAM